MTGRTAACLALCLSSIASGAEPRSYAQTKALADRNEAGLSAADARTLGDAQRDVGGEILPACSVAGMNTLPLTVVMQLDATGRVVRPWRQGESTIAPCFERASARRTFPAPDNAPFYTAFAMAWTR
jgi:protein-L-isoaspartate O-methyltransferase